MTEREDQLILQKAKDYIRYVHFACPAGRVYPGEADIQVKEYVTFFDNLKKAGYNGRVSVKAFAKEFIEDAKKSLKLLKNITILQR